MRYFGRDEVVVIPMQVGGKTVTAIGDIVYYEYKLTIIVIPDSVTSIGNGTFADNREISFAPDNTVIYGENLLNTVTIGTNVELGERGNPSFDNGFDDFYNANGRKAGTYVCRNGQWDMAAQQ
jgi:hypothetical protein